MGSGVSHTEVLLIDRSRLFREGLRSIFATSEYPIEYEASSFEEAIELLKSAHPGLVLMNIDMGADLRGAMAGLRSLVAPARIVVLTEVFRADRLAEALAAGADAYLLKDMSAEALQQSLRLVLLGEKVFPTDLANLLVNGRIMPNNGAANSPQASILSERETQILVCLLNGDSNKSIANQLEIAEGTVKVHLKTMLKKIHARNRTQAAIWALNHGVGADLFVQAQRHSEDRTE